MTLGAIEELKACQLILLRTSVHPGVSELLNSGLIAHAVVLAFDPLYQQADDFGRLYEEISGRISRLLAPDEAPWSVQVADLQVLWAAGPLSDDAVKRIGYVTPGSPNVAERTVELLLERHGNDVGVSASMSFVDMAFARMGIDPFQVGVTLVDSAEFCAHSDRYRGAILLSQVWNPHLAQEVLDIVGSSDAEVDVTYLFHLGTIDERVVCRPSHDLAGLEFDHLTSLYVGDFTASASAAFLGLVEVVARLRRECPWDQKQSHASLGKHLIEESYEVIDAIESLVLAGLGTSIDPNESSPVDGELQFLGDELAGELGDLVVQVLFHAVIGAEEKLFDLRFVFETITAKLIRRHPHVFLGLEVAGVDEVLSNWESIKRTEKAISEPAQGVPTSLPALLFSAKVLRKAGAFGYVTPPEEELRSLIASKALDIDDADSLAELVFRSAELARFLGIDLEAELRALALRFSSRLREP